MNETVNLNIERASNGYILSGINTNDFPYKLVISEKEEIEENNLNELKTAQEMLREVLEYFGIFNSKHNKYRLEIIIKNDKNFEVDDNE